MNLARLVSRWTTRPVAPRAVRPLFLDPGLQSAFDRDGFVVVPFVDDARRQRLVDLFDALGNPPASGFRVSLHDPDAEYRAAMRRGLNDLAGDLPRRYLREARVVMATFLAKMPGEDSATSVHQDYSFVDESRFDSVNCWMPLTTVTPADGPLMVLRGSHRLFPADRGAHQPLFASGGLRDVIRERYLEALSVPPGEAVLFNSRIVHFSPANRGSKLRLAASLVLVPAEAQALHYYRHDDGRTEVYEVGPDFYYDHAPGQRPDGERSLGCVPTPHAVITTRDLDRLKKSCSPS